MVSGRLQFYCSGAVVTNRFVLTVARCVNQLVVPAQISDLATNIWFKESIFIQDSTLVLWKTILLSFVCSDDSFSISSQIQLPTVVSTTGWGSSTVSNSNSFACDKIVNVLHHFE